MKTSRRMPTWWPTRCALVLLSALALGVGTTGRCLADDVIHVSSGQVGIATNSPIGRMEVHDDVVAPTATQPTLFLNNVSGPPRLEQRNGAGGHTWRQTVTGSGTYNVDDLLDGVIELVLAQNGNLTISGNVITTNCPSGCGPDYVFAPDYELMPLAELGAFVTENRHLPNVPSAKEMQAEGIDMTALQLRMLEKIEELTLYTLEQQRTIERQSALLSQQQVAIEELRLAARRLEQGW